MCSRREFEHGEPTSETHVPRSAPHAAHYHADVFCLRLYHLVHTPKLRRTPIDQLEERKSMCTLLGSIFNELLETQADTVSLQICHDIDELSKVFKEITTDGEVITKLKSRSLGPRFANLPSSPHPLKVVLSAMRDILMKSCFHLRGLHLNIFSHRLSTKGTAKIGRGSPVAQTSSSFSPGIPKR